MISQKNIGPSIVNKKCEMWLLFLGHFTRFLARNTGWHKLICQPSHSQRCMQHVKAILLPLVQRRCCHGRNPGRVPTPRLQTIELLVLCHVLLAFLWLLSVLCPAAFFSRALWNILMTTWQHVHPGASYLQVGSIYKISRIQWDLYINLGPKRGQFPIYFQWLRATPRKHAHNPGRTSATTCFLPRKPSFIRLTPMFSALFSSRTVMPYRVPEESELPPHFPDVLRWSKSELKHIEATAISKKTSRRWYSWILDLILWL